MISSVGLFIWTGYRNSDPKSIIDWFANGEVSFSPLMGAAASGSSNESIREDFFHNNPDNIPYFSIYVVS